MIRYNLMVSNVSHLSMERRESVLQYSRNRRYVPATSLGSSLVVMIAALATVLLASCDEEDRSAVPPGAVSDLATVVSEASPEGTGADDAPGVLDEQVQGVNLPLSERVYFAHGGDIWQAPVNGNPAPVVEGEQVVDYSASATGHRIALLLIEIDDQGQERTVLSIRHPDGTTLLDLSDIDEDVDLDAVSRIESVALSPDGNTLAMTHQNGAMTMASLDGEVQQLANPGDSQQPGRLAWSSDGRFIAYLDPWMPDEPSSLYVVVPESGVRQIMVSPSSSGHGVLQAEWIPGTSYIVFIKSSGSTITHGGDVFLLDVTTGERHLFLSSSEFAPVAGVVDLVTSPDGRFAAVTAFVPGGDYPDFSGLWTIDLRSGERNRLDVEDAHSVTDIWWLGDRLLFRTIDEPRTRLPGTYTGQEAFRLVEYAPQNGEIEERYVEEAD